MNANLFKNRRESGFTLIEIIAVLVILGILAAVAVPKYIDMQDKARASAVQGMAGSLSSASALNFAARSVDSGKGSAIDSCTDISALTVGFDSKKYTIADGSVDAGATVECTVADATNEDLTAKFIAHGIK